MPTDEKFKTFFEKAVEEAEQLHKEKKDTFLNTFKSKTFKKDLTKDGIIQNSEQLESADTLIKQADAIFQFDMEDGSSSSYEGGEDSESNGKTFEKKKEVLRQIYNSFPM
jgi:hypothetical protein